MILIIFKKFIQNSREIHTKFIGNSREIHASNFRSEIRTPKPCQNLLKITRACKKFTQYSHNIHTTFSGGGSGGSSSKRARARQLQLERSRAGAEEVSCQVGQVLFILSRCGRMHPVAKIVCIFWPLNVATGFGFWSLAASIVPTSYQSESGVEIFNTRPKNQQKKK